MTKNKRILFISQEIAYYLPDTEISLISRNLPQGIQELGREIRAFMPKYGSVNERRNQLHEVIRLSGMNIIINDTDHPLIIKVGTIPSARIQVYFIDNEDFFHKKNLLSDMHGTEYSDNDERSIFFVRGVLETVKKLRWLPDLIHCHGWLTALAPIYLKRKYHDEPGLSGAKIVYSLYEENFKNPFDSALASKMRQDGISERDLSLIKNATDAEALTNLAIKFADGIIQGSPTISEDTRAFIEKEKKPYLPYQTPENYIDAYNNFYTSILSTSKSR
ncbi:MAG: glycogen/starch synthase [Tannerella sp.]|jgi:starch synthase|nr:glycogen/starch synthase [Tannerella sp.]